MGRLFRAYFLSLILTAIQGIHMTDSFTTERYYRESHQAICDLITPENEHLPVPACPGWTLHDLLAHVTGVLQDFIAGNTEGAPGPDWTAAQVERFRDTRIEAIASAWRASLDQAGPIFRRMGNQFLPDIVTHEFDVRGAIGNTDERSSDRLAVAVNVMTSWGDAHYKSAGIPALALQTDRKYATLGGDVPQATVATNVFEALRVLTGRRSSAQIRALDWSTDPSPWLDHMSTLGRRDTDLVE